MKVQISETLSPEGIKRLTEVIEWLEKGAPHIKRGGVQVHGFAMDFGVLWQGCGSICCLAGALCQFNEPFSRDPEYSEAIWRGANGVRGRAARLLGLDLERDSDWVLAMKLFRENQPNEHITPAVAAATLRHFLDTGELAWPEPEEDQPDEQQEP